MNYDRDERIAIRMCSGMTEREAIKLTDTEGKPPECIERLQQLKARKTMDDAERNAKRARKVYD